MAKIPSFPLILIAPVVSATLHKNKQVNTNKGKTGTIETAQGKFPRLYIPLTSLLMLTFFIVVYSGWISWLILLSFILGCLLLNGYYVYKIFSKSVAGKTAGKAGRAETIDWSNVLSGRVLQPTSSSRAAAGSSEDFFSVYLKRYFDGIVFVGEAFPIPNSTLQYSSDFSVVLPDGLSIIIEIDEPYYFKDGTPTHCVDRSKDNDRNDFFLAGSWSIIRFAEEQIVTNPEGCCLEIATLLFKLTYDEGYLEKFASTVSPVKEIQCWNHSEAEIMAKGKYRDHYLAESGIKQGLPR